LSRNNLLCKEKVGEYWATNLSLGEYSAPIIIEKIKTLVATFELQAE